MGMFETLAKVMSASDTLKLRCGACGHETALDRRSAFGFFGADATPYSVTRKARCLACGERRRIKAWV